jgi:hypothetical protein
LIELRKEEQEGEEEGQREMAGQMIIEVSATSGLLHWETTNVSRYDITSIPAWRKTLRAGTTSWFGGL